MTEDKRSGVRRAIDAAGGPMALARRWSVTYYAINKFERQGYFPLPRARDMAEAFDIPLRDMVRADIAEAMDAA